MEYPEQIQRDCPALHWLLAISFRHTVAPKAGFYDKTLFPNQTQTLPIKHTMGRLWGFYWTRMGTLYGKDMGPCLRQKGFGKGTRNSMGRNWAYRSKMVSSRERQFRNERNADVVLHMSTCPWWLADLTCAHRYRYTRSLDITCKCILSICLTSLTRTFACRCHILPAPLLLQSWDEEHSQCPRLQVLPTPGCTD